MRLAPLEDKLPISEWQRRRRLQIADGRSRTDDGAPPELSDDTSHRNAPAACAAASIQA